MTVLTQITSRRTKWLLLLPLWCLLGVFTAPLGAQAASGIPASHIAQTSSTTLRSELETCNANSLIVGVRGSGDSCYANEADAASTSNGIICSVLTGACCTDVTSSSARCLDRNTSFFTPIPIIPVATAPTTTDEKTITGNGIEFTPELPIPGLFKGAQPADNTLMSKYIRAMYIYFIWIVGIVAVVMVIYGGIRWIVAGGNAGQIKEARDIINNAIIGVIIGLTSIILLNLINPRLTNLQLPGLTYVKYQANMVVPYPCDPQTGIKCGEIAKLGTYQDDKKNEQEYYCLGVKCDKAISVCQVKRQTIPLADQITINNKKISTYYVPGVGCVDRLTVLPPDNSSFFEETRDLFIGYNTCGQAEYQDQGGTVRAKTVFVGGKCGRPGVLQCVAISGEVKAEVITESGNEAIADSIQQKYSLSNVWCIGS